MAFVDALGYSMPERESATQTPNYHYSKTLLNCFPGGCRTMPLISRSKSVARTSEEFKPERSTMPSIGSGIPATIRFRIGKFSGAGGVRNGNSLMIARVPALFHIASCLFSFG
jgi:hypothetical protein